MEKTVRLNEAFYSFTQASKSLEAYYLKLGEKVQYLNNPVNWSLKEMEMDLIFRTLEETSGNKTRAAKILGVSVRTIRNKLQEYGNNFPAA